MAHHMNPNVPPRLERLPDLSYNLFWTWRPETQQVFASLEEILEKMGQGLNPRP